MRECYAIKPPNTGDQLAPLTEQSGINLLNNLIGSLTKEQRIEHGWYYCELYNEEYDEAAYIRSEKPTCVYDSTIDKVIATFELTLRDVEDIREARCVQVTSLYKEKLYSDATVEFPDGLKVIQFRDEGDRANLANTTQAAISLILAGQPTAIIPQRTKDNVTQMVTASELVSIGNEVLYSKQLLLNVAQNHKDALRQMTDPIEAAHYDITVGQ